MPVGGMRRHNPKARIVNVITWGEIDSSWIGRRVRVRWEDEGMPLAEGLPSGVPHERTGRVVQDFSQIQIGFAVMDAFGSAFRPPAHALVQEEEPNE